LEMCAAEAQAMRTRPVRRKPFRIDIEHEEDRAVLEIGRQEIVRFPGVHRDDRLFCKKPALVADVDLRRRSADVEDQVALAMRMHVEGAVQLINRRTTEPAMEDGKRPAHALPPAGCFLLSEKRSTSGEGMQEPERSRACQRLDGRREKYVSTSYTPE